MIFDSVVIIIIYAYGLSPGACSLGEMSESVVPLVIFPLFDVSARSRGGFGSHGVLNKMYKKLQNKMLLNNNIQYDVSPSVRVQKTTKFN